ncbi:hypothetical protein LTR37_020336 [Vermiconidia calcicola]|uniref:Uncharacterized protein n=1 Tax=Vermiconidia calcicola TaxID=1690605 RepID=A0ACC3MEM4_9PEZI|nr:hypothetical protein LTR37_020336 [Vermiconidia calcicola]
MQSLQSLPLEQDKRPSKHQLALENATELRDIIKQVGGKAAWNSFLESRKFPHKLYDVGRNEVISDKQKPLERFAITGFVRTGDAKLSIDILIADVQWQPLARVMMYDKGHMLLSDFFGVWRRRVNKWRLIERLEWEEFWDKIELLVDDHGHLVVHGSIGSLRVTAEGLQQTKAGATLLHSDATRAKLEQTEAGEDAVTLRDATWE